MKGKLKLEKDPSGRSRCHGCGRIIPRLSNRVLEIYYGRFTIKDKYCDSCGVDLIKKTIKELDQMLIQITEDILNETTKKD